MTTHPTLHELALLSIHLRDAPRRRREPDRTRLQIELARIRSAVPPDKWPDFVKMLAAIDRSQEPLAVEIRRKLEHIALHDERFQDRLKAMLPLLLRLAPMGSVQ